MTTCHVKPRLWKTMFLSVSLHEPYHKKVTKLIYIAETESCVHNSKKLKQFCMWISFILCLSYYGSSDTKATFKQQGKVRRWCSTGNQILTPLLREGFRLPFNGLVQIFSDKNKMKLSLRSVTYQ